MFKCMCNFIYFFLIFQVDERERERQGQASRWDTRVCRSATCVGFKFLKVFKNILYIFKVTKANGKIWLLKWTRGIMSIAVSRKRMSDCCKSVLCGAKPPTATTTRRITRRTRTRTRTRRRTRRNYLLVHQLGLVVVEKQQLAVAQEQCK